MSHTLKGSIISSLVAALAMFAFGSTAFASTATTIAIPSQCASNTTPVLTVTQQITEADTAVGGGTWATDSFTETANVYTSSDPSYAYCAVGTINSGGTFTTTGPNSPQAGTSLKAGITGSISGGETWLIPSGTTIDAGITGTTYTATPVNAPTQDSKFSDWQTAVFGAKTGATDFSFTYVTDANPSITWLNDGAGNSGDITNPTMTTIYVNGATGDDTNNIGTQAYPYKTIQAAVNALPSGGTINVAAGTYTGDVTVNASNLTINGAGVGSSIINLGSGYGISLDNGGGTAETGFSMSGFTVNSSSGTTYAFKGYKSDNLTLSNMDFEGGSYGGGVDLNTTSHATITNVKANGFHKNGFAVTSAYTASDSSTPSSHITFSGITATNNGWAGVALYTIGNSGGSADITSVAFSGSNTVTGNAKGVEIVGDTDANVALGATPPNKATSDGTTLDLSTVAFSGNTSFDVVNYQTAPVNAIGATFSGKTGNSMDAAEQTSEDALIYDSKDNAALGTVNYYTQTTTTNTDGTVSAEVHSDQTLSGTSTDGGSVAVTATIPAGTTVTGDATWDGVISAPTASTTTVTLGGNLTADVKAAIAIGSSGHNLIFDHAVQLVFTGLAHMSAGWYDAGGTFTAIGDVCTDNTQAGQDASLAAGGSCYMDSGSDLVVWTKHFSTFVVYNAVVSGSGGGSSSGGGSGNGPIASSGGGGGGGGSVVVALPNNGGTTGTTATTGTGTGTTGTTNTGSGQVLGAAAYNFAVNLTVGSKGTDVTELQKVLIAEGDLSIDAPTGYFGSLTKAAVVKYQKAHGITPASGYVGPLTRAELNKGSTPTSADEKASLIQTLLTQVQALQNQLNALKATTSTSTSHY